MLPPLIAGKDKACFAVTEPDAGLDTTALKVRAERRGDHYVLSGQKIWISTAQVANKDPDPRPHHAARSGQAQDRGLEPVLHRSRSQQGRHPRDRQDGPPLRSTPNEMFFDAMSDPGPPTASAPRATASARSCTA
jgi:alkylation response protein AidB-like acyl-CoA dehydrogenase